MGKFFVSFKVLLLAFMLLFYSFLLGGGGGIQLYQLEVYIRCLLPFYIFIGDGDEILQASMLYSGLTCQWELNLVCGTNRLVRPS